ncbi:hypothetical protein [Thermocrinis sp.]
MRSLVFLALIFLFSCAPMLCRIDPSLAINYSENRAPQRYVSYISISHGAIRIPLKLEKDGSRYKVEASRIPSLSFDSKGLCLNGVCFDLPFGPDGIIFGALLTGKEKVSCSPDGLTLSRELGDYLIKYYFANKDLSRVEILDRRKERVVALNYGLKTKEGYYRRVKVSTEDLSFTINIEGVSF